MNNDQKIILEYLENVYTDAEMANDVDAMIRISRAIEAFKLPIDKGCVIETK